jgi:ubiquinone/menaquinone biosynthesis C-methylase UbiE
MPLPHETAEGRRFDRFAAGYDQSEQSPIRDQVRNETLTLVRARAPTIVLDVGCGTGRALIALADQLHRGIGMDVSRRMLDVANENARSAGCRNLEFRYGSFLDLQTQHWPQQDRPEVVMTTYALHHLPRDEKRRAMAAMAGVLPNGRGGIVIGDLMFFEDPSAWKDDFERVGYNPDTDQPEMAETLVQMADELGFAVRTFDVHPLAGVVLAERP